MMESIFAPAGGWMVRLVDLSGGNKCEGEEVRGFTTLMHANAFARAYVRDSVERCRWPGASPRDVTAAWHAFGEDAEVIGAGDLGWSSAAELAFFAANPAPPGSEERDWRSLDPRRLADADD